MNRTFNPRAALRTMAVGVGPMACVGTFIATRPVIRCDAPTLATGPPQRRYRSSFDVSPEIVKQVSRGSITGFGVGVLVALFSKTLTFFGGLFALSIHIAGRYGIDVTRFLRVDKLLNKSSLWAKSKNKPLFTLSFLVTFILAGFVRL